MTDREFKALLDRQSELLDAVKQHGVLAAIRYKSEMERGARAVIAECYRRLETGARPE